MRTTVVFFAGLLLITFQIKSQSVTDYEGNLYDTVRIGTQVWLKENLKATKYNDGTDIPLIADSAEWSNLTTPGYCWYNNDESSFKNSYGALYNWFSINSNKLCPIDWHVPSDAEWTTLTEYLGGNLIAGGKLKETGANHWDTPNDGATNETEFTAIAAGYRHASGYFDNLGHDAYWWTSSEYDVDNYWQRSIAHHNSYINREYFGFNYGLSVRCLKNSFTHIHNVNNQKAIRIYPNPANDKIYIECAEIIELKVQIYNLLGECILQKELKSIDNSIDISSLVDGIYIIDIVMLNKILKQKLIKN